MRNKLAVLILLIALAWAGYGYAQRFQPKFVTEFDGFLFTVQDSFFVDESSMDSIFGEKWMKVYRSSFTEGSSSPNSGRIFVGYTRREGSRVYFSDITFPEKTGLLYDFGLQKGDTVLTLPWQGFISSRFDSILYEVDSIKYMNCSFGDSTKLLYVSAYESTGERGFVYHQTVWIEGIGDIQHPYPPQTCFTTTCESVNRYNKYYHDGVWYELWNDRGTAQLPCQEIITSTRRPMLDFPVSISPNPVSPGEQLFVEVSNFKADRVRLIGLTDGRLVAEWPAAGDEAAAVTIPSGVPAGIYGLLLTDRAGRLARGKVIVR